MMRLHTNTITKNESRDTGMAMVLLALLLCAALKQQRLLYAAMALHVLNMVMPQIFRPVAVVWLGGSNLLGAVMSRVLLSVVFFGIVTPMGILRRVGGKDSLKLRAFKASDESVMLDRHHVFTASDLEKPY